LPDVPLLAPAAAGLDDGARLAARIHLWQNADPPYAADNVHVLVHWLKDALLRTAATARQVSQRIVSLLRVSSMSSRRRLGSIQLSSDCAD
jgi:hypothetical protein